MSTAERSLNALEYIVHDLLALMLRANDDGFSPQEVLAAIEFVLRQSHLVLNEEKDPREIPGPGRPDQRDSATKMVH